MTRAGWIILPVLAALTATTAVCQSAASGPTKGIVWAPPEHFADLRTDLERIGGEGAEAVRTALVLDPNVQIVGDLFGVSFFQELDARFMPAARFAERRPEMTAALDSAIETASQFDARQQFGLGYWVDTSVPETCQVIRDLSDRVHDRLPAAQTYYVTAFIESDICAEAVDFVLVDAEGASPVSDLVHRWRIHSDVPVGISSIGFPVREDAGHGYRSTFSAEYQARMLERELRYLLGDRNLRAVFVDRWRARTKLSDEATDKVGDYGITAPNGDARPASDVVRGLYTGNQQVFAFDAGKRSDDDFSWINLISFLSVTLFGLTYYGSISLRSIVRRYFLSHSIYIEKLSDGREATVGTSMFLLLCLSLAASVVGMTVLTDLSGTRLWHPILHWLPGWLSEPLQIGLARSGLLIPVFASLFAIITLLWAAILSISTRGTRRLRFGQTLLTAVMPRWPVALIGLLALVMLNWRIDAPGFVLLAVMGVWFTVVLTYTGRMLSDFLRLLGIRALWTVPVLFLGLCLLAVSVWLFVVTNDLQPEIGYLWNIARGT